MRPYLILAAVVLMAVAAFGQQPFSHRGYGACLDGCAPFVPLVTTPEISLEQISPNPVGASNATTGLIAGATNSTLSELAGSTSSTYTVAVWVRGGGAPIMTPAVHLTPELLGREGRVMREAVRKEHLPEEHVSQAQASGAWTYFTGWEHTADAAEAASVAKGLKKAGRVYTNDDVARQNDQNGAVKYDGKTEKM